MLYSYLETPYKAILSAIKEDKVYASLVPSDAEWVVKAVNQGIDSHLDAVVNSTFKWEPDEYVGKRLICQIAPFDLCIILRRLAEMEDESAEDLRSAFLESLEIEEV
jgi:hypothetical protein